MLSLQWPWLLLALPLPWLVYKFVPAYKTQQSQVFAPSLMMLAEQKERPAASPHMSVWLLATVVWLCLLLAATRPTFVGEPQAITSSERNMMLAVDLSDSMKEEDMAFKGRLVNRLQTVKAVLTEFIAKRQGDRLGLILFGSQAYVQTPLTFDLATLQILLDEATFGLAGRKTAIGDAIGLGVKRLLDLPASSRVLIILTDGQNTAGEIEPLQAAKLAAQAGVKIYTIGIGADELVVQGFFGPKRINPSRDLDEATLTTIATDTGGQYYRARNLAELAQIYSLLDELEAIETEAQSIRPEKSLFHYPLGLALLLACCLYAMQLPAFSRLVTRAKQAHAKYTDKGQAHV
ncbi:MAG: VWA domain-containing protein [Bermanella sp.]|jgi:Mg-chelatase subunit ChlD